MLLLGGMAALGIAVLERFARFLSVVERWAYGIPLGMVLGTLPIVPLASLVGFSAPLIVATVAAEVALAFVLLHGSGARWPRIPAAGWWLAQGRWLPLLVLGLLTARWAVTWTNAIVATPDGGLYANHVTLWGDWTVHIGNVASFVYAGNFPPAHPRFEGAPFGYHYLSDLTAAMLVPFGLQPAAALQLHSFVLCVAVAVGLYAFARRLSGSRLAASLAVVLFVYGGTLAWLLTAAAIDGSGDVVGTLLTKAWDFRYRNAGFEWVNMFWGFWAPQRAFLYGMPIAFIVLRTTSLAHRVPGYRRWVLAGVIAGLLPLAHLGTLLALALVVPVLFLLRPSRGWIVYGLVWVAVAVPQLLLIGGGGGGALAATRIQFGWVGEDEAIWFWLKNLGPFLALLPVALFARVLPEPWRRMLGAFMVLFVVANVVVFQPWDWDNHKFLVYWFLATTILVGAVLARAWLRGGAPARALVVGALVVMLLSGALEDLGQALGQSRYQMIDRDGIAIGERIRTELPPRALFLTGMRNQDVAQVIAGRQLLVGHDDWLWAEGIRYEQRRADAIRILRLEADAGSLLARYGVEYVLVGPYERDEHGADADAWATAYPTVLEVGDYRVFDVRSGAAGS